MKSSRLVLGFAAGICIIALGCSESPPPSGVSVHSVVPPVTQGDGIPCGDPLIVDLLAGQYIDVGEVTVWNDADDLFVLIETTGGWLLTETHVAIATSMEELPQTGSGNPKVGHFDLSAEHDPPVATYQYHVAYEYEPGVEVFIAVHAVVVLFDEEGNPVQEETAWADGLEFPGNSWATYFTYLVADCGGGEEIVVTVPETVCLYDPFPISWQPAGDESHVEITLLRGDGSLCTVINPFWDNIGSYDFWDAVPLCQEDDDPYPGIYRIRITDPDTGAFGESSDFEIESCGGGEE